MATIIPSAAIAGSSSYTPQLNPLAPNYGSVGLVVQTAPKFVVVDVNTLTAAAGHSAAERQQPVAGINSVLPIVYGRQRVGAKICAVTTYQGNLVLLCAWCMGEVNSVEKVEINDEDAPSGVTVASYVGTPTGDLDSTMQAAFTGYADYLPGVCYSVISVPSGTVSGFPRPAAIIQGLKVSTTEGGAKSYQTNPAYILADFIESTTYGRGGNVDWTTVATVAAHCAESIGSPAEARSLLNVVMDSTQDVETWITVLAEYANCWAVAEGDTYYLVLDADGAASASFDADSILQGSMKIKKKSARNSETAVQVAYTETATVPWRDEQVTVYRDGVLAGTVPRRMSRVTKPGIVRSTEAYRIAVQRLNDATTSDMAIRFVGFDPAAEVRPGDKINVTHPRFGGPKAFRVTQNSPIEPGRWSISAVEFDAGKYSTAVVSAPTTPDTTLDSPTNPPTVAGLTASEDDYQTQDGLWNARIALAWTRPIYSYLRRYRVEVFLGSLSGTLVYTADVSVENAVTQPLSEGSTYAVRVTVESTVGAYGTGATTSAYLTGKAAVPSDVPLITATCVSGQVRIQWTSATDRDLTAHELRYGATGGSWATATLIDYVPSPATTYYTNALPAGTWRIWVKGLDSVRTATYPHGQESANATYVDVVVDASPLSYPSWTAEASANTLDDMEYSALLGGWITWDQTKTWASRFTAAMSTYTGALASYYNPDSASSSLTTASGDSGTIHTALWTWTPVDSAQAGSPTYYVEYSDNGSAWTTPAAGLSVVASARYVRGKIASSGTGVNLITSLGNLTSYIESDPVTQDGSGNVSITGTLTVGGEAVLSGVQSDPAYWM